MIGGFNVLGAVMVYSDGACRNNPGQSSVGVLICDPSGGVLEEHSATIGHHTNNEAEYLALAQALILASSHTKGKVECFLDSELVVNQLNGSYRVRQSRLAELAEEVQRLAEQFNDVSFTHTRRDTEMISRADMLANRALDDEDQTHSHVLPDMQEEAARGIDAALRAAMNQVREEGQ
jgi:ribonuclease HI